MRRLAFSFACLLVALPAAAQEFVPGRVLVRYRGKSTTHLLRVKDTRRALESIGADPDIDFVEPDYIRRRTSITPNDDMYKFQWALPMIRAPQAWSTTTGSAQVTVAVIDSGILPHPDLKDRLVTGYDFISDPANANDGDGRDGDPTDQGDASMQSSALHGMHVAGVIGASSDNHTGVAGVDWNCRILPVRVLGVRGGSGVDSDIADAIRWAAGLHVDGVPDNATPASVINMSFGGKGTSQTMQAAIDDAIAAGATIVAAAGNLGIDAAGDSPAGLKGVIAVGAVDQTGQMANYSNFGPSVALMAPGGVLVSDANGISEGILSTIELPTAGFTYIYYAGTSQAAPFVTGAISLMKAIEPRLGPKDARKLLLASADPGSRCQSPEDPTKMGCGAGLLDLNAALALAQSQKDCAPACGDELVCQQGQCVSISSIVPGMSVNGSGGAVGGCDLSGARSGSLGLALLLACGLILLIRRKV